VPQLLQRCDFMQGARMPHERACWRVYAFHGAALALSANFVTTFLHCDGLAAAG